MDQKALVIVLCLLASFMVTQCTTVGEEDGQTQRSNFRMPKLFRFDQFKSMFNKHYKSLAEEVRRRGLFLANAFRAFVSVVKFHHYQSDYYLWINHMSDETVEERMRNRMQLDKLIGDDPAKAMKPMTAEERQKALDDEKKLREKQVTMTPEELRQNLLTLEQHQSEPQYEPLADELHRLQNANQREKRDVGMSIESDGNDDKLQKVGVGSGNSAQNMLQDLANTVMKSPIVQNAANMLQNAMGNGKPNEPLPDEVFVDLRETGCMNPIENQLWCGSCYAFSVLTLYEYLFCRATGYKVRFSKQYMVSCGQWTYMGRCYGGYFGSAFQFVDRYGLELSQNWGYEARDGECPYKPGEKDAIRLHKPGFGLVEFEHFDEYLKERPIVISLDFPADFDFFGGGLYTPDGGCLTRGRAHAMLIVGHGRQDGKEYYLFRNSYGLVFGEQGYAKVNKAHVRNCTSMLYGFGSDAEFPPDAFEKLQSRNASLEFEEVPKEGRWAPLKFNSEIGRLLKSVHPDFVEV